MAVRCRGAVAETNATYPARKSGKAFLAVAQLASRGNIAKWACSGISMIELRRRPNFASVLKFALS